MNAIQLLAVTETWLSTSIHDDSITLSGFQTPFRKDRDKIGGGVCIYASTELACKRWEDLETDGLEMIWVEVLNIMKQPLLVGCCYRPPSADSRFYDLEDAIEKSITCNILLLGDFNAKHSAWCDTDRTNTDGNKIKYLLDSCSITQLCSQPAHLANDGRPKSLLDLII